MFVAVWMAKSAFRFLWKTVRFRIFERSGAYSAQGLFSNELAGKCRSQQAVDAPKESDDASWLLGDAAFSDCGSNTFISLVSQWVDAILKDS